MYLYLSKVRAVGCLDTQFRLQKRFKFAVDRKQMVDDFAGVKKNL